MKFFELLKIALGHIDMFTEPPSDKEWKDIFAMSVKQALIGIMFTGVERLPASQRPPRELILRWYILVGKIERRNKFMNSACSNVYESFFQRGFDCCVLKGQGIAIYYPDSLRRQSGDIDAWVLPKDREGKRVDWCADKVIENVHGRKGGARASYHNVSSSEFEGVEVEVHYRPSFMYSPFSNRKLQRFFTTHSKGQLIHKAKLHEGYVAVPTPEFNAVFLLSHIYRHVFQDGIGLRQLLDYYYLLVKTELAKDTIKRKKIVDQLKKCNMTNIARAVMFVLGKAFGLKKEYMIVEPDERLGNFLLNEIMITGNFGQYDERVSDSARKSALGRNLQRLKRDLMLFRYFPSESMAEPFFRLYHWFWRRRMNRAK